MKTLSPSKRISPGRFKWQKLRLNVMERDRGICQICNTPVLPGHPLLSPVVDHIIPHRGDEYLYTDYENLQLLHKSCHDKKSQDEKLVHPRLPAVGEDGWAM